MVIYGLLRGCLEIWHAARAEGRNWLYIDNGYLKPGHFDGHYSLTWNAFQHTGQGDFTRGHERAKRLDVKMEEWKKSGAHILLFPPTEVFAALHRFTPEQWVDDTTQKLRKYTDREVRIRLKPGSTWKGKIVQKGASLREDLEGAHCSVTYNSKAAMEGMLWGFPTFVTTRNICSALAKHDLRDIENPIREGDRDQWLAAIAANQWTLDEIRSGQCFQELKSDLDDKRTIPPPPNEPVRKFFP